MGGCGFIPIPPPTACAAKLAKFHRCAPENIIVGNGSDELLALATRAFVEPGPNRPIFHAQLFPLSRAGGNPRRAAQRRSVGSGLRAASVSRLAAGSGQWDFRAALTFVTTPNAPSGRGYAPRNWKNFAARKKAWWCWTKLTSILRGKTPLRSR